ncbi:MAG: competence/damage-inducible protein A [Pseudomonadota bacterium]
MIAHIISTGDEILLGDIIDTNSSFLCQVLRETGVQVHKIICVGDDPDHICQAIQDVSTHADICLMTGGLGPTKDDLTALACTRAAKVSLEQNKSAFEAMTVYFKKRGLKLTLENEKQAMLPKGSKILINSNGTAPGFYMKINQCLFFFLPGPPSEMKPMFENQVKPVLLKEFNLKHDLIVERVTVFMLKESMLGVMLDKFETLFPDMILGIRVSFPTIEVKMRFAEQPIKIDKAISKMAIAKKWVLGQLGKKVVSETGKSIVKEVAALLTKQKKTLAVAESCTGGLISNLITDMSGSSDYFLFSAVTYSNEAKVAVLNVKESTLIKYGAVHEQTAREMAQGAREKIGADIAISTTGIAGPTGGTKEKPVGMVCIGLAGQGFSTAKTFVFNIDDRDKNKKIFAMSALEMLRQHLVSAAQTT